MLKVQEEQGYQQRDHGCTGVLGEQDKKRGTLLGCGGKEKLFSIEIFFNVFISYYTGIDLSLSRF
jgi:hypothetical protein